MTLTLIELLGLWHDPVYHGWEPSGASFGMPMLHGQHWAIPDPDPGEESVAAVALFRGTSVGEIDYERCVGLSLGKQESVDEGTLFERPADSWLVYDVRAVNGAGIIGELGEPPIRVHTDGDAAIELIPNPPAAIGAEPLPQGRARVRVSYSPDGQCVAPTDVQVFLKQLTDPYDTSDLSNLYDTPLVDEITGLSEVPFRRWLTVHTFIVPKQGDGWYVFGARFRNEAGAGDGNNVISNVIECSSVAPPSDVSFKVL